jgi:hypothetical protein
VAHTSEQKNTRETVSRDKRGWLALLLSLTLIRGLIYLSVTPPWQSPDETGHFEYAWLIAHRGQLPIEVTLSPLFERELLSSLYEWRYGEYIGRPLPEQMPAQLNDLPPQIFAQRSRTVLMGRFSPAYLWQALFVWPLRHQDFVLQLYAARFSSVILNMVIVWLAWRIFAEVTPPSSGWAAAMTAFVVFLPQHTFINASVNEGPLAELCACVALYGWLRLFRQVHWSDTVAVLGGTVIGLWTKNTAAFLLPFDALMLMLFAARRYSGTTRGKQLKYMILAIALVTLLGLVALQTPSGRMIQTILQQWWAAPQFYLEDGRVSLGQALWQSFDSFWARFGLMSVQTGPAWYLLAYILTLWAIEGWAFPRLSHQFTSVHSTWLLGIALLSAVAVWLVFMLITPYGLAYYQGRYLFPMVVPVAFFLVGGWARWMPVQRYFAPGVMILLATMDAAALCLALLPYFYGG